MTSNKAEAFQFLQRLLTESAAQRRGDHPRHLYGDASERFLREASIRPKTRACYATSDRMCRSILAGRYLHEIDRRLLGELVSARKQAGVSDTTIRRDLAYLSSMCSAAISWGWLDTNPVTQFNKRVLKDVRPRTRFLSRAEYDRLLGAASARLARAIVLAVETGPRRGELFGLTVGRLDLRRREIVLDQTKGGAPRRVPLSAVATATILDSCRRQSPERGGLPVRPARRNLLHRLQEGLRGGMPSRADHRPALADLRHTFASWLAQSGGDLYHLSRLLGHSTVQMSARYGHLRTHDLHAALEKVAQNRSQDRLIATGAGRDAAV